MRRILVKQFGCFYIYEELENAVWYNGPLRDESIDSWKTLVCGGMTTYPSLDDVIEESILVDEIS